MDEKGRHGRDYCEECGNMSAMSEQSQAKRLFDMEIDEISLVKRAANRHATVAFSKSDDTEDQVSDFFDADGELVVEDELSDGDNVYDDDGNEYVYLEEDDESLVEEPEFVGKTLNPALLPAAALSKLRGIAGGAGKKVKKHPAKTAAGVTALAGGGALAATQMRKSDTMDDMIDEQVPETPSLGDLLLEELSKSEDSGARDELLAAAVEEIEIVKAEAAEAQEAADYERDIRVEEAFISKAATYNLPVAPEVLGPILKAAATALTDEQLDVLDQLFDSVGDTLFDEIGAVGDTDNASVMHQVDAAALELVGKSDDITGEVASAALFDANPDLYDAYLAEGR